MSEKQESTKKEVQIGFVWGDIEGIPTTYANQFLISHAGEEFYLVFGEVFLGNIDINNPPSSIIIEPKIKMAIAPNMMGKIIKAIQDNYERYLKKQEKQNV